MALGVAARPSAMVSGPDGCPGRELSSGRRERLAALGLEPGHLATQGLGGEGGQGEPGGPVDGRPGGSPAR